MQDLITTLKIETLAAVRILITLGLLTACVYVYELVREHAADLTRRRHLKRR